MSDERFFVVKVSDTALSRKGWTPEEAIIMTDHRWWSRDELMNTDAVVWPENLIAMLEAFDE